MAAAASSTSDWSVLRDGCLRCDAEGLRSLCYHPALNAILAVTSRGSITVIDGTSGAILQASALNVGDGALPPAHHVLKLVASAVVNELKKINQNVAALSVASSILDRLSYLLSSARPELGVGPGRSVDRSLMYSEANRRETFTSWPHAGYRWAQPDPMAQAGFYHQPASTGDDRAMCFTCSVCLVCWEPTDEPWSEHERHSPNCPFVKGEHTQNVPLSVTLATSPAQLPNSSDLSDRISCYGFGSCPQFLAAATRRGKVCIWDVSKMMKVHLKFDLNPYDPVILRQLLVCSGEQSQSLSESRRPTLAWLEESSCSDLPKLEGDSDDQLEDSDSEDHSRSESVTVSVGQHGRPPLRLRALGSAAAGEAAVGGGGQRVGGHRQGPGGTRGQSLFSLPAVESLRPAKSKDRPLEHHNIPFPCLLAGGLLSYRSAPNNTPTASASSPRRTEPDHGAMEIENAASSEQQQQQAFPNSQPSSPSPSGPNARRSVPVLLLYSIREVDDKSTGQVFTQMNNLMSNHEEGFTVPQIIEMEFDSHEQLLLQDPPITYIQQFADAAGNLAALDGHVDKWSTLASAANVSTPFPKPGSLVQCLRLPKALENETLYVDSITPCFDGVHLLIGLQQSCGAESLTATNQVEALNNLNRLHSALSKADNLHNGVESHPKTASQQLILPPNDPEEHPHRSLNQGGGYLALYKLNYSTRIVTLDEEPVKLQQISDPMDAITSLILLPPDVLDSREEDSEESQDDTPKNGAPKSGKSSPQTALGPGGARRADVSGLGHLVVTTRAGFIMILDLSTLEVLAKVEPPKKEGSGDETDPFVSVTYCSGTDRLCAATRGGELHFLQIGGVCDDVDDGDMFIDGPLSKGSEVLLEGAKPCSNPSSPGIIGVDLLVEQPLSADCLMSLVELTRFETLTPRFSATVPPCWVEVQQEQQQRRHPQHLHQQHHGDAAQHTRTWKLQSDSSSWDEHVLELVLPKACMVGHVDFKFVLNSNIVNIPQIQVTLLKNKAPGLGKVSETPVDRPISFPLSNLQSNGERNGPLLHDFSEDIQFMDIEDTAGSMLCPFLEEHREDILCGPVWLARMAGGKYRSFLVHIKAVTDKSLEDSPRPVVRMPSSKPQGSKGHSLSTLLQRAQASKEKVTGIKSETATPSKKVENLRGCDLLQEVSVTIRRFKKTSITKERVQRCAMLQFPDFHERLLETLCRPLEGVGCTEHAQSLILDILCWLAGVFSNGPCSLKEGKEALLLKTRLRLNDIVRVCFFEAGRSIAHKCARFLALCISNGKGESAQQGFGVSLLKALIENMPYLPAAATGGQYKHHCFGMKS
ncbi:hypothetical protein WMY93_018493 [Mugilogobius chulae]|uniref:UBC core domain-containing protein n=1 Tax=Mugilogobius chulae TaxID=88201 RepID=A0AAW0NQI3_9GOBI